MKLIAELCQNHNGREDVLERMVGDAAAAGATHVKIQHAYASNLSFRPMFEEGYDKRGVKIIKRPYQAEVDRMSKLELTPVQTEKFVNICEAHNVIPLTTCFYTQSISQIKELGFKHIKVASYDCASFPMLEKLKNTFEYIYVSTGATFDSEIKKAAEILKDNFSFLHCVTRYPTPLDAVNFSRMDWLKQFTSEVGYSDHSAPAVLDVLPTLLAIYRGAEVIERHFTILEKDETKDGPVSVNPEQLKKISDFSKLSRAEMEAELLKYDAKIPEVEEYSGYVMTAEELSNREYYRGRFSSIVEENGVQRFVYNWEQSDLI